jgi:hypothetical protein
MVSVWRIIVQYHITEQIHGRQWEQEQHSVVDDVRRRVQHDLEAQNPGGTVTISSVQHTIRNASEMTAPQNDGNYLVEFVVEYTVSGHPNTFAT